MLSDEGAKAGPKAPKQADDSKLKVSDRNRLLLAEHRCVPTAPTQVRLDDPESNRLDQRT